MIHASQEAPLQITTHAIHRYQERIANLTAEQVQAALDIPAVRCALRIGAPFVRLASGHRIVLEDGKIITILPKGVWQWTMVKDRYNQHRRGEDDE